MDFVVWMLLGLFCVIFLCGFCCVDVVGFILCNFFVWIQLDWSSLLLML